MVIITYISGGFHKWGYPKWMVYNDHISDVVNGSPRGRNGRWSQKAQRQTVKGEFLCFTQYSDIIYLCDIYIYTFINDIDIYIYCIYTHHILIVYTKMCIIYNISILHVLVYIHVCIHAGKMHGFLRMYWAKKVPGGLPALVGLWAFRDSHMGG